MSKARVAELRQGAEAAITAIDAQPVPDNESVRARRDEARAAAVMALKLAREPITIGVVGEFSAGKSLLIGALLGKPDLLPVAGKAVTGNITALRLRPGNSAATYTDEMVTVEYLSQERLAKAAEHMVSRLREACANVPGLDVSGLHELDTAQDNFFDGLEKWCRKLWVGQGIEQESNPEVLHAAWELMRLRETVRNAGSLIGQQVAVAADLAAEAALDLGDRPPIPRTFPEPKGATVDRSLIGESAEALRATFALIYRVVYKVSVPPAVWNLSALRDENEVMLLDFPGLNSDASHNRDEYLSTSELAEVSTILVVLKGDHPGAKGPLRFYGMMQRAGRDRAALNDAILVAGNQFDLVQAPEVPADRAIGVEELSALSEDFRGFRTAVRDLTGHQVERCQLVSSVAGMAQYGWAYHAGSDETRAKIGAAIHTAPGKVAMWEAVGQRIEAMAPGDPWSAQLRALGHDGGIRALQALIEHHARIRGLRLKIEVMERHHRKMVSAMERFARSVDPPDGTAASARAQHERLSAYLRSVSTSLTEARQQAAVFRDPARFIAASESDDEAGTVIPLVDELRREAIQRVYRWPHWNDILGRTEDFLVPRPADPGQRGTALPPPIEDDWEDNGTDTTNVLHDRFRKLVEQIDRIARHRVSAAANLWVNERDEERGHLRENYSDTDLHDLITAAVDELDAEPKIRQSRLRAIELAIGLGWFAPRFNKLIAQLPAPESGADRFPLLPDHRLPWHADFPKEWDGFGDRFNRHQLQVFRMRRAIANAAADLVTDQVSTALATLAEDVEHSVDLLRRRLPNADLLMSTGMEADLPATRPPVGPPGEVGPVRALLTRWSVRS